MNPSIRTPLHVRHQTAADLGNWSVARDVQWNRVPRLEGEGSVPVNGIREACLIEAVQLVTLARLAADVATDMDASVALAIVATESAKHFHALRLYLESCHARPRLTDTEIAGARAAVVNFPARLAPIEGAVGLLKAAHMASHFYRTLASRSREPVLRDLLRLIAADKVRHGRMASDILECWVESDRRLATRVMAVAGQLGDLERATVPMTDRDWPPAERAPLRTLGMRLERICGRHAAQDVGRPEGLEIGAVVAVG